MGPRNDHAGCARDMLLRYAPSITCPGVPPHKPTFARRAPRLPVNAKHSALWKAPPTRGHHVSAPDIKARIPLVCKPSLAVSSVPKHRFPPNPKLPPAASRKKNISNIPRHNPRQELSNLGGARRPWHLPEPSASVSEDASATPPRRRWYPPCDIVREARRHAPARANWLASERLSGGAGTGAPGGVR